MKSYSLTSSEISSEEISILFNTFLKKFHTWEETRKNTNALKDSNEHLSVFLKSCLSYLSQDNPDSKKIFSLLTTSISEYGNASIGSYIFKSFIFNLEDQKNNNEEPLYITMTIIIFNLKDQKNNKEPSHFDISINMLEDYVSLLIKLKKQSGNNKKLYILSFELGRYFIDIFTLTLNKHNYLGMLYKLLANDLLLHGEINHVRKIAKIPEIQELLYDYICSLTTEKQKQAFNDAYYHRSTAFGEFFQTSIHPLSFLPFEMFHAKQGRTMNKIKTKLGEFEKEESIQALEGKFVQFSINNTYSQDVQQFVPINSSPSLYPNLQDYNQHENITNNIQDMPQPKIVLESTRPSKFPQPFFYSPEKKRSLQTNNQNNQDLPPPYDSEKNSNNVNNMFSIFNTNQLEKALPPCPKHTIRIEDSTGEKQITEKKRIGPQQSFG